MATLLPNPKLFSSQSFADYRNNLPFYFSRPALSINSEKPVWASAISSRWWRECSINFASRRRSRAFSTSATFVSEKEDCEDDEEEEEEVEGEEFIPLREMTRWLQNKPAGFGEGKRYDTTVEDKVLEEIKWDRQHHIGQNGTPREREKENAASVKKQEKQKVTEVIKTDPEVRVWNLPKKKNIDRDLWKAFKGFPGILSINPAVTGNRKTRDPICRGFAFIGFESNDDAYRFVQKYSKQILLFGKAQKQIYCNVINVHGVLNSPESSKSSSITCSNTSELRRSEEEISISDPLHISKSTNGTEPNKFSLSNNEKQVNEALRFNNPMLAYQNGKKIAKRNKTKAPKSSKAHILGSLAKLKIKDRAVLTGVFSKYGEVASAASKEI